MRRTRAGGCRASECCFRVWAVRGWEADMLLLQVCGREFLEEGLEGCGWA